MIKKALKRVLDLVYPKNVTCDVCNRELDGSQKEECICNDCLKGLTPTIQRNISLSGVNVYHCFEYEGMAKKIILDCKDFDKPYLAELMAYFMCRALADKHGCFEVVCFVPSHKKKMRKRGYSHTQLIAKHIAEHFNIPLNKDLKQTKAIKDQTMLSAEERKKNVVGCFSCTSTALKNKKVLLVDDIVTTGATLSECANALRKVGVYDITAVCFAY